MKTVTKHKILDFIKKNHQVKPIELLNHLGIGGSALHRHLKKMVSEGQLVKLGSAPKVFYRLADEEKLPQQSMVFSPDLIPAINVIEKNFLYIKPDGAIENGVRGFMTWSKVTNQNTSFAKLAKEYLKIITQAQKLKSPDGLIHALDKIKQTFKSVKLDELLYQDFYSLPKFGKTKLGFKVLYAKQSQSRQLMNELAEEMQSVLGEIINKYQISIVGFIPHSIKRQLPLLQTLERILNLSAPRLDLVKVYQGSFPVAQKSLTRLEDRIENARKTIAVNEMVVGDNVLLIDDAVGSGATLNETALKLKEQYGVKKVIGYAIVGSLKGFPVISEI